MASRCFARLVRPTTAAHLRRITPSSAVTLQSRYFTTIKSSNLDINKSTNTSKDGDHALSLDNPIYRDLIGSIKNRGIAKAVDYLARTKDPNARIADIGAFYPDKALYFNLPNLPPGVNGHESDPDGIPLPPGTFRASSVPELRAVLTEVLRAISRTGKSEDADNSSTPENTAASWNEITKEEVPPVTQKEAEISQSQSSRSLNEEQKYVHNGKAAEDAATGPDKEKESAAASETYREIAMAIERIEQKLKKLENDESKRLQRGFARNVDLKRRLLRDFDLEMLLPSHAYRVGEGVSTQGAPPNANESTNPAETTRKENLETSSTKNSIPESQEWFTRQDKPGADWDADVPPSMKGKFYAKITQNFPKAGWINIEGNNGSRFGFDIAAARKLLGLNDTMPAQSPPNASTAPPVVKVENPEQSGKPEKSSSPADEIEFKPVTKRVTLMDILRGSSGSSLADTEEPSSQSISKTEASNKVEKPEVSEGLRRNHQPREGKSVEFVDEGAEYSDPRQVTKGLEEYYEEYRQNEARSAPTELRDMFDTLIQRNEQGQQDLASFRSELEKTLESKLEIVNSRIDSLSTLLKQVLENQEKAAQEAATARNTAGCVYTTHAEQSDGQPKVPVAVRLDEEDEKRIQEMVDTAVRTITNNIVYSLEQKIDAEIDRVPSYVSNHLQQQMPNMVQNAVNNAMVKVLKTEAFQELVEAAVDQVAEVIDEDREERMKECMDGIVPEVTEALDGILKEKLAEIDIKLGKLQRLIKGNQYSPFL
ncbi:hypothetical protein TWF694_006903 [Orbilia ellipsospora]|uniref:Uncharacterized protein n=1 Tax=Orbilia ellipsospora TaxID=2528407 RepID=A0AAV9XMG4_9PEZI